MFGLWLIFFFPCSVSGFHANNFARPTKYLRSTTVELSDEVDETLRVYLSGKQMMRKVAEEAMVDSARYAGILFEPKPYSEEMPRGVPRDVEQFLDSETHVVVNVPPVVMFKAKCFKPSKLCAVYELDGRHQISYMAPSTAQGGPIGEAGFDYGEDSDFDDQLV